MASQCSEKGEEAQWIMPNIVIFLEATSNYKKYFEAERHEHILCSGIITGSKWE